MPTRLDLYDNSWYHPGAGIFKRTAWYYVNVLIFNHGLFPFSFLKVLLLRLFGAKVGRSVVVKPTVNIKYPWRLEIGDFTWIGENVWIDNLDMVRIADHCCISQGAMLLCGNHNMNKSGFDLIVKPISLEVGAWVGARAIVCPGVVIGDHSVLTAGSVAIHKIEPNAVYQGNPARKIRNRMVDDVEMNG